MAKNGLKMVETFLGASHMINDNIFNIFCFSTFSFGYFTIPVFWPNLEKIALKTYHCHMPGHILKKLQGIGVPVLQGCRPAKIG